MRRGGSNVRLLVMMIPDIIIIAVIIINVSETTPPPPHSEGLDKLMILVILSWSLYQVLDFLIYLPVDPIPVKVTMNG